MNGGCDRSLKQPRKNQLMLPAIPATGPMACRFTKASGKGGGVTGIDRPPEIAVILAIPARMRQAPIIVFHCILLWSPHQAHIRRTTPASVKPLQVALVEPVAYSSTQLLLRARRRQARERHLTSSFTNIITVKTVGEIPERDTRGGIGPPRLSAKARMPEGLR